MLPMPSEGTGLGLTYSMINRWNQRFNLIIMSNKYARVSNKFIPFQLGLFG